MSAICRHNVSTRNIPANSVKNTNYWWILLICPENCRFSVNIMSLANVFELISEGMLNLVSVVGEVLDKLGHPSRIGFKLSGNRGTSKGLTPFRFWVNNERWEGEPTPDRLSLLRQKWTLVAGCTVCTTSCNFFRSTILHLSQKVGVIVLFE
ncbi:hypothetical protein Ancab_010360 [Ancistrocladus abbreviatus]